MRPMGVYIHIPFCVQKCVYCDFLSAPATGPRQQAYMAALREEMARESAQYIGYEVETIFFGGGTPSIIGTEEIAGILECLGKHYRIKDNAEITMEMNPGTADAGKLLEYKKMGINRLSMGLQSADNAELKMLGRIHTYEDFLRTYHQAREAGFSNINVDLMSALPGQGIKSWAQTLGKVSALRPEHISAYSLIIEEGTCLYDRLDEYPPLPDEDEDRLMDQKTRRILAEKGYYRYEVSNYAKKGYECRHNCTYWQRGVRHTTDYVGFGLGAASMVGNVRWKNTADMERYLGAFAKDNVIKSDQPCIGMGNPNKGSRRETIKTDVQRLSERDCMEEYMFLGLRMTKGVSRSEFADSFGVGMDGIYGEVLRRWEQQGMLVQKGDSVCLTEAGIDVSNRVLADFLL